jgi:trigger factor
MEDAAMGLKSSNKVETNKIVLEIEIDAEAFEKAVQAAYMKAKNNISIPGFRKGKAPRKMIEKLYGEGAFYEDAINAIVPVETAKAVTESNLDIVDRPEIEVVSVDKGTGVLFKATCIVKPEVEVKDYKGIEVKKVVNAVTDADVDAQVEKIREKGARLVTVEGRTAQSGDDVVFDFEGFIDGVAFEGGSAENFELTLGSGQFIPGFEDQIIGHNAGEEFEINVTFPENYQMKEIAGKPAVFKIKLHEIKAKELPALDDEFVKDLTEFETLAELKDDIRKKLEENAVKKAESEVEDKIFETVIANTSAEIPQVMFDNRINEMVNDFAYRLSAQGIKLDLYLQYMGMSLDAFKKTFEERAKNEVTLRLALEKIAKLENVAVSDEELEEEFKKLADAHKMELERVKQIVHPEDFRLDIAVGKAAEIVRSSAKISE